jgi:hypothetical protein
MRRAPIFVSLTIAAATVVTSCGQRHENRSAEAFGIPTSGAPSRCASLPLKQASDPACKREGDENLKKFLGKGAGS